jgi:uncharacterized protein YndB with AHSA1/START domain
VTLRGSQEVLIDASPEEILDVLADVASLPSWSPLHSSAEVVDVYPDGRPHHVKVVGKFMGVVDRQLLEYHWGENWVVWDAVETSCTRALHGEYNLEPGHGTTRVRFGITFEQTGVRTALVAWGAKRLLLDGYTNGLNRRVTGRSGT